MLIAKPLVLILSKRFPCFGVYSQSHRQLPEPAESFYWMRG